MAWHQCLPLDRTEWSGGCDSHPLWPSEPDVSIITSLAASALDVDEEDITVDFFADGANHIVYDVVFKDAPSTLTAYLFRVAVPIDPTLKLESEVATLEFLSQRTKIPVSKPVAWNSSAANELGYEWLMVEKIPGVMLYDVWSEIPWDKKVKIAETLATYLAEMWSEDLRFSQIGSLYFESFVDRDAHAACSPTSTFNTPNPFTMTKIDDVRHTGFRIGPSTDGDFFCGRRRYLTSNRGPFPSCTDWLTSLIEVEREFLRSAKLPLETRDTMPAEHQAQEWKHLADDIGVDEGDFLYGFQSMVKTCDQYLDLLPVLFPRQEMESQEHPSTVKSPYILHHCDLREANILVDPQTFPITGIIDWEQTGTVPEWYGLDYPIFINKQKPLHEQRPDEPSASDHDQRNPPWNAVEYELWIAQDLRKVFDRKLEMLGFGGEGEWRPRSDGDVLKSTFIEGISNLSDCWDTAVYKLRSVRMG